MKIVNSFKIECVIDEATIKTRMDPYEVYLDIEGGVKIFVADRLLYSEILPVVEFTILLERWLTNGYKLRQDFVYHSLEAEEPLFWIKFGYKGFNVGSEFQFYSENRMVNESSVIDSIKFFILYVSEELSKYGYDFQKYVEDKNLDSYNSLNINRGHS